MENMFDSLAIREIYCENINAENLQSMNEMFKIILALVMTIYIRLILLSFLLKIIKYRKNILKS